jgi:hypothetical protein
MKRVPTESCHTPAGFLMEAEVAFPPSPEEEATPFPATVAIRYNGGAEADVGLKVTKTEIGINF